MKKKKIVVILAAAVVIAAAAGVAIKYKLGDTKTVSGANGTESVFVDSVATLTGVEASGIQNRFSGVVEPQKTVSIQGGDKKVKEVYVKEGDQVKAGQELFIYDTSETEENILEAEIEIDRLEASIESTKAQIETLKQEKAKLTSEDAILEMTNRIQTMENAQKKSEYDLKKQNVSLEQLKNSLNNSTVTSEIDGVVKTINESMMNGDDSNAYSYSAEEDSNAFMTILATGNYRIKGTVNEQNRGSIMEGAVATVYSRVDPEQTWEGTMSAIDTNNPTNGNSNSMMYGDSGSGDNSSSSYNFYVNLESADGLILGQHVYIVPGKKSEKEGMWLSSYYIVQEEGAQPYVWAASAEDTLEKKEVTLGEYDEATQEYEITGGLGADDYIAFPTEELAEGMRTERNVSQDSLINSGASSAEGMDDESYVGEDGSYVGEDSYSGEDGSYLGGEDSYSGEDVSYLGEEDSYLGEDGSYLGEGDSYSGELSDDGTYEFLDEGDYGGEEVYDEEEYIPEDTEDETADGTIFNETEGAEE